MRLAKVVTSKGEVDTLAAYYCCPVVQWVYTESDTQLLRYAL